MSLCDATLGVRAEPDPWSFTCDDRQWRVRGLDSQHSGLRLRVNLLVARQGLSHVDTLDLYSARQRRMFVQEAAAELCVEETVLKGDLGRLLCRLEEQQETLRQRTLSTHDLDVPEMSEEERREALDLLEDPQLIARVLADYEACGLVGEETSKLVCYLACTSRLLPRPLSVLIQSSSAAGKTSLVEGTLRLMPPEAVHRMSALTPQSLYYMQRHQLRHKILSVAEEEGVAQAAYALKLLQSEGVLRMACVGRDTATGRPQTQHLEVEGPVAMLLTTTAPHPDAELQNRCLTLYVCEQPQQTAAIHQYQRDHCASAPPRCVLGTQQRHQQAQRLLQPLRVVIPFARQLTFRTDQTRYRRDHAHYLSLIAASALVHQYQRQRVTQQGEPCLLATLDDLELANRLAGAALAAASHSLLPQTRQLLRQISTYVGQRAQQQRIPPEQVRFTQRQLREALSWSDHSLRRQLTRLVELEYVLTYRTGQGNQRAYQLLHGGQDGEGMPLVWGLTDVAQLRHGATPGASFPAYSPAE